MAMGIPMAVNRRYSSGYGYGYGYGYIVVGMGYAYGYEYGMVGRCAVVLWCGGAVVTAVRGRALMRVATTWYQFI